MFETTDYVIKGDPLTAETPPSPSGSGGGIAYGTCTTAGNVAVKAVTLSDATGWELKQGASVAVKFSNTNTFSATSQDPVTLNVNNTGAKNIYYGGSANPTGANTTAFGRANYVNTYVYDGTYWVWTGSSADNNTTYSAMSKSELTTGTATTSRVVRADYLKQGIEEIIEDKDTNFVGTRAEWDALSVAEKAKYLTMDFTDDSGFGDISDEDVTFTSSDVVDANANSWTVVSPIASGTTLNTLFSRVSQMFKNIRYLYKQVTPTVLWSGDQGNYAGRSDNLSYALSKSYKNFRILRFYIRVAPDSDNLPKRPIVRDISTEQLDWIRTQASTYTLSMGWGYGDRTDFVDVQNSSTDNNLIITLNKSKVQKIEGINV